MYGSVLSVNRFVGLMQRACTIVQMVLAVQMLVATYASKDYFEPIEGNVLSGSRRVSICIYVRRSTR